MRTELWAVALALVATGLAAVAALFLKWGAAETRFALPAPHINRWVYGAIGLYLVSSLLFLLALLGAQLSTLLPLTALEYVWIALLAQRFLGERLDTPKVTGIVLIAVGVFLVGLGS